MIFLLGFLCRASRISVLIECTESCLALKEKRADIGRILSARLKENAIEILWPSLQTEILISVCRSVYT